MAAEDWDVSADGSVCLSHLTSVSPEPDDGSWWWSSTVWNIYFDCNNSWPGSQFWQCSRLNKIASHAPGLVRLTIPTGRTGNKHLVRLLSLHNNSVLCPPLVSLSLSEQKIFVVSWYEDGWLGGWLVCKIYRKSGLGRINLLCVELLVFPYLTEIEITHCNSVLIHNSNKKMIWLFIATKITNIHTRDNLAHWTLTGHWTLAITLQDNWTKMPILSTKKMPKTFNWPDAW